MDAINRIYTKVRAVSPIDFNTGNNTGDVISMKNYGHCDVHIDVGVTTGTAAVTLRKGVSVSSCATSLSFTRAFMTGVKIKYTARTATFTIGETVTGAGGASIVVYKDNGDYLLGYTVNATAFVDAETITGATSGSTATANGIGVDEDILLPFTVTSDTFTIPAVSARSYVIPVDSNMLGDGYDCMGVYIAQATAGCIAEAYYILTDPRHAGTPMQTAIYD